MTTPAITTTRRRRLAVAATAAAVVVGLVGSPSAADPISDADYADAAHTVLVGRPASESERTTWVTALGTGASRRSLVDPVTQGEELEAILVEAEYLGILGRAPDPGGAGYWLDVLQQPGATLRSFEIRLLASSELRTAVGGSAEDLVEAYYDLVLRRAPGADERAYWVGRLQSGTSAATIARGFLASVEARRLDVTLAYEAFLGRPVDAGGLAFWTERLGRTGDEQALWTALIVSDEFYDGSAPRNRALAAPAPAALRLLVLGA